MSKQAHLADGTILDFPDDTPDEVVDRVVKQHVTGNAQAAPQSPDNRTAMQVAGDQAINVVKGIPQAITGIPASLMGAGSALYDMVTGKGTGKAQDMLSGMAKPFVTAGKGAIELAAPGKVTPPTREEWESAAQAGGAMLGSAVLPEVVGGIAKGAGSLASKAASAMKERALMASRLNPVQAEAVAAADRAGLPVDLATRTGSPVIKAVKMAVDSTPVVSRHGSRASLALDPAIQAVLEKFSDVNKLDPDGPTVDTSGSFGENSSKFADSGMKPTVGPTKAATGRGIRSDLTDKITAMRDAGKAGYDKINAIPTEKVQVGTEKVYDPAANNAVENPFYKDMAAPTDVTAPKAFARQVIAELEPEIPEVQRVASPGLNILKQIAALPDKVDLTTADGALSQLKRVVRDGSLSKDVPQMRTRSGAIAASMIQPMEDAVAVAAKKAGVADVLMDARKNWRAMNEVSDALDSLSHEPVQLVQKLTRPGDASIEALKTIQKHAPQAAQQLGKSVMRGIIEEATNEGGFKSDRAFSTFSKLGAETKDALFGATDGKQIGDILQFGKMAKSNFNPSGSAKALITAGAIDGLWNNAPLATAATYLGAETLARVIYSPASRGLLKTGMKFARVGNKPAAIHFFREATILANSKDRSRVSSVSQ